MNPKIFLSILCVTFLISSLSTNAQYAGRNVYQFLDFANSARVNSLGSNYLVVDDDDIDLAYSNPSLITKEMHHQLSINYIDYLSDISSGLFSYGHHFKKAGTFVGSMQFVNYSKFKENSIEGVETGEFTAGEYALVIGWSKKISDKLIVGTSIKNIFSSLESYNSYGLAADVALTYSDREKFWSSSLILSNIGRQISTYTGEKNEKIPFEIKLGIAKKLEHAPFRLILLLNNLQRWDLRYKDPNNTDNIDPFSGEEKKESSGIVFGDNLLRHATIATEFVPGKGNFFIRLGYNYRRQREMKIANKSGFVGYSFGVGLKVYKFKIIYSRASYHLAGGTNTIGIGTDLDSFF